MSSYKIFLFPSFFFFFNYVSVSAEARSVRSVEAELQVDVSCLMVVVGIKLRSSGRAVHALNC